mgnify:CR=1 FL=1
MTFFAKFATSVKKKMLIGVWRGFNALVKLFTSTCILSSIPVLRAIFRVRSPNRISCGFSAFSNFIKTSSLPSRALVLGCSRQRMLKRGLNGPGNCRNNIDNSNNNNHLFPFHCRSVSLRYQTMIDGTPTCMR